MLNKILRQLIPFTLLFCALPASAQLSSQGKEQPITYSGKVAPLAANTPALNFAITTGTNTFILATQPETAARVYIVNETANACIGAFQISVATTAQKNIGSFNNFLRNWVPVPIINNTTGNYSATSGLVDIPANGQVVVTSAAIAGQNVAVLVVNTTGACATTSIDVNVVFATVAINSPLINVAAGGVVVQPGNIVNAQGVVGDGVSLASVLPVGIGGKTTPNNGVPNAARFVNVLNEGATDLCATNCYGLMLGAGNLNVLNNFTGLSVPNTGPMASMLFGQNVSNSTSNATFSSFSNPGGVPGTIGPQAANSSMNSLFVQSNGFATLTASTTINGSQQVAIFGPAWRYGTFDNCYFTVDTGAPTGTTPTLDVYVQSSNDGTNYSDRVHFTQLTTTANTQHQYAGLAGMIGGFNPTLDTVRTLAATTRVDGPIGGWLRWDLVLGGTGGPTFPTTQLGVACH